MAKPVIYDSLNKLVWVEGQKGEKSLPKRDDRHVYGADAKRFSNNSQARAYVIKIARLHGAKVWDSYYGEYLGGEKKKDFVSGVLSKF